MMKLLPELLQQMQHNSSPEPSPKLNNTRQTAELSLASKNLSQQPQKSSYEIELSKSCDNRIAKCENVLTTTDLNNESSSLCPKESDLSICNKDKTKIDSILDFETIQDPIQIDTSKNLQMSVIKKFDKDIQVSTINIEKIIQVPEIVKENGETDINSSNCVQNDEESRKPLVICIKRKKKNGSRGKVAKSKTTTTNSRSEDEFTTAGVQEEVIKDTKTIVKNKSKKEKGNLSNIDENGNFTSLKTKQNKDVKKDSRSKKNSNFEQKDNELQKQSTPKTCTIDTFPGVS